MKAHQAFSIIEKFIFSSRTSEDVHIKSAIGAIGIRSDGAIVRAVNGSIRNSYGQSNCTNGQESKSSIYHAEGRILNKMDSGGVIYVARKRRDNNELAMARPCSLCQMNVKSHRISKVFYTIDNYHYGIFYPKSNTDKICLF